MDHADTASTTGMLMATATGAMAEATGTGAAMDMSMGNGCKISMLINYNTIDACFISENWQITSRGMFAGSCIGVVLLAIFLEFLRRSVKELDKYLVKQHVARYTGGLSSNSSSVSNNKEGNMRATTCAPAIPPFRPSLWQQGVRALLHTAQFTVAYFIMLLAMYYNVYILVCIFLGILVGNTIFGYETLAFASGSQVEVNEPTVCCG